MKANKQNNILDFLKLRIQIKSKNKMMFSHRESLRKNKDFKSFSNAYELELD